MMGNKTTVYIYMVVLRIAGIVNKQHPRKLAKKVESVNERVDEQRFDRGGVDVGVHGLYRFVRGFRVGDRDQNRSSTSTKHCQPLHICEG